MKRGTENEETLKTRLENAKTEVEFCIKNDKSAVGYKMINGDRETAKKLFAQIVEGLYSQELKSGT